MSMQTAHAVMRIAGIKSRMITINEAGEDRPALMVETEKLWRLAAYLTRDYTVEKSGARALIY